MVRIMADVQGSVSSTAVMPLRMVEDRRARRPRMRSKKPKVKTGCKTWLASIF
jgi:hypothetical protein